MALNRVSKVLHLHNCSANLAAMHHFQDLRFED